jgi:hypothetical protein
LLNFTVHRSYLRDIGAVPEGIVPPAAQLERGVDVRFGCDGHE